MEGIKCPNCGTINPVGFKFCGQCGTRLEQSVPVAPPMASQGPSARLVVVQSDGQDGESLELSTNKPTIIGRTQGDIIVGNKDPYLSPQHASFTYRNGVVIVEDLDSLNGILVKISQPITLQFGDIFMVGRHFFKIGKPEDLSGWHQIDDGTYFFYTSQNPVPFLIIEIEDGGFEGNVYRPVEGILTIGREGNLVNISEDPFVSSHHAMVKEENSSVLLVDQGSKNGTFVKIHGSYELQHGDMIFIGSELMRVEIE